MVENDNEYFTRREAEIILENREKEAEQHMQKHTLENEARDLALQVEARERTYHGESHTKEHSAHESKHLAEREAIKVAMDAVGRERVIHADAHAREHSAHQLEHSLSNVAIDKAEKQNDRRFDDLRLENNRRYEELRARMELIEKSGVKGEGRQLGQAATVGLIVGAIGFFSTILGIVVVAINVLTAA